MLMVCYNISKIVKNMKSRLNIFLIGLDFFCEVEKNHFEHYNTIRFFQLSQFHIFYF